MVDVDVTAYLTVRKLASGTKIDGHQEWSQIPLGKRPILLGRPSSETQPDIRIIGDMCISRKHALMSYDADANRFDLSDCDSKWGTYLNNQPLEPKKKYALAHGDLIGLAQTNEGMRVEFSFTKSDMTIDPEGLVIRIREKKVCLNGVEKKITPAEWKVLEVLYHNQGQYCSYSKIADEVSSAYQHIQEKWPSENYIAKLISRLRSELEPNRSDPEYIVGEFDEASGQFGYKLMLGGK